MLQINILMRRAGIFLIAVVCVAVIADLGYLMLKVLTQWQLMEPAENENLVLTWSLSKSYDNSLAGLLSRGILPIYPVLYHRISSILPFSPQFSGRFLSVLAHVGAMLCVALYAKKRTRSWLIAGLFSILLFGHPTHSVYFLMQRVDSFYICMGTLSVVLVWWNFSADEPLSQNILEMEFWRCFAGGVALGFALLSKQSAIFFIGLHIIPFALSWLFGFHFRGFKKLSGILVSACIVIGLYWLLFNRSVIDEFAIGLTKFGAHPWTLGYMHQALTKQESFVFFDDGYIFYVLAVLVAVAASWRSYAYSQICFGFAGCCLAGILTLRMWLNDAAFFNNFIFISLMGILLTIHFWPKKALNSQSLVIFPLLACAIFSNIGVKTTDLLALARFKPLIIEEHLAKTMSSGSYRYEFAEKLSKFSGADPIFKYIEEHPGVYISTRLDNYLINANREVEFEASVLGDFTYGRDNIDKYTENMYIRSGVRLLNERLLERIRGQYYQGVLLGLAADSFIAAYPELLTHYKLNESRRIVQGNSEFDALLYVRKVGPK